MPLISKYYGDRNTWLDFFDMFNTKTYITYINIRKNINMLLNFEFQGNERYEDYDLKNHITLCDTTFTSTSIMKYRRIKQIEV